MWIGPYISSGTWHESYRTSACLCRANVFHLHLSRLWLVWLLVGLYLIVFSQHYFPAWSLPDTNVGYKMLMWTWWVCPRNWLSQGELQLRKWGAFYPLMDIAMFLICDTGEIIFLQKADSNLFRPISIHVTHWFTCGAVTEGDMGKNTRCPVQPKCSPFGQWPKLLWQLSGCCLWGGWGQFCLIQKKAICQLSSDPCRLPLNEHTQLPSCVLI